MKLNLNLLKNVLCDENYFDNVDESKVLIESWGDGEVEINEWLERFSEWWNMMCEIDGIEYGDSDCIENILKIGRAHV